MSSIRVRRIMSDIILVSAILLWPIDLCQLKQAPGADNTTSVSILPGYVFSEDGNYVAVDVKNYKVSEQRNLWKQIFESNRQSNRYQSFVSSQTLKVVGDQHEGRAFILVGVPKSGLLQGYLILNLESLKPIGVIRQEMMLDTAALAIDSPRRKIYLSYLNPKENREGKTPSVTVVYSSQDYRELARYESSDLRIQSLACFSEGGDKLYTNQRVFDTATDTLVRETVFLGKPFLPVACQLGRVLFLSKAEDSSTVLGVYEAFSDQEIKRIKTNIPFRADGRSWALSKDCQVVIFDEEKLVRVGQGQAVQKTGVLVLFSTSASVKAGEVRLPGGGTENSGILGFSFDGSKLFYRADDKMFVISLAGMSVLAEISLPFRPIGVIWP